MRGVNPFDSASSSYNCEQRRSLPNNPRCRRSLLPST